MAFSMQNQKQKGATVADNMLAEWYVAYKGVSVALIVLHR
jgi:hypothetical protein